MIERCNLENEIKVLDKGFVRLVDHMGDDSSITQAARTSYGDGTKSVSEDRALIRYLMRMMHTSPLEMVEFKFHIKCPIFVMRQQIRHRTANVNEYSGRYSEMRDEFYVPDESRIVNQSTTNKQGSSDKQLHNATSHRIMFEAEQDNAYRSYKDKLDDGMSREIARINLPLSNYTEFYWKMDLHNLFHFLRLRMDSHAQYEIQVFANAIYELIKPIVPIACEAFEDYRLNADSLSAEELHILRHIIFSRNITKEDILAEIQSEDNKLSKREINEFMVKLGYSI